MVGTMVAKQSSFLSRALDRQQHARLRPPLDLRRNKPRVQSHAAADAPEVVPDRPVHHVAVWALESSLKTAMGHSLLEQGVVLCRGVMTLHMHLYAVLLNERGGLASHLGAHDKLARKGMYLMIGVTALEPNGELHRGLADIRFARIYDQST